MNYSVFIMCSALMFVAGCRPSEAVKTNAQTNTAVEVGAEYKVTLESNPSTGYSWKWMNRNSVNIVDSTGYEYISKNPELCGSGGWEIWTFTARKSGVDTLRFEYNRSFEKHSTARRQSFTIKVE